MKMPPSKAPNPPPVELELIVNLKKCVFKKKLNIEYYKDSVRHPIHLQMNYNY
jgi:hypothetical protein